MAKVKLAEEKKKMARVDTHAAKRFVRNALWQAPQASTSKDTQPPEQTDERVEEDSEDTGEFEAPAAKRLKQDNTAEPETSTTSSETKKKSKKKKSKKEKKEKKEKKKKKDDSD